MSKPMTGSSGGEGAADTRHLLEYASLFVAFLLLVKAYGVANYSLTTTGELITTAPVTALLGTVVSYEYIVLPLIAVVLPWVVLSSRRSLPAIIQVSLLSIAAISALLSPWVYLWPVLLFAITIAVVARLISGYPAAAPAAQLVAGRYSVAFFTAMVATGFFLVTLNKPWVPAEIIVFKTPVLVSPVGNIHSRMPIVYVLSDDGGWITALAAESRYVFRVRMERVEARFICHEPSQLHGRRPLFWVFEHKQYHSPNLRCQRQLKGIRRDSTRL